MDEHFRRTRYERLHPEKRTEGEHRRPSERDRDRILYTSAFRRLSQVTQVVAADNAHVFHNRLTHSLQVAQVGRRIAEMLRRTPAQSAIAENFGGLNPNVVEAACLAHDLGHPPFGHVAEEELDSLASNFGGFEGNAQSFRIITKLAYRSRAYLGLNLTRATLAAVLKYPWYRNDNPSNPRKWGAYFSESDDFDFATELLSAENQRSIEAEIMDWADDVTYSVHDIEDFYRAGRIPLHLLGSIPSERGAQQKERKHFFDDVFRRRKGQPGVWSKYSRSELEQAFTDVMMDFRINEPYAGSQEHRMRLRSFTGRLIGRYINAIELRNPRTSKSPRVRINDADKKQVAMLKELTWTYVIEAQELASQQYGQKRIIKDLFAIFQNATIRNTRIFPVFYREKLTQCKNDDERTRVVVDMIAGMTERQAVAAYQQLTGITLGTGLNAILT